MMYVAGVRASIYHVADGGREKGEGDTYLIHAPCSLAFHSIADGPQTLYFRVTHEHILK